VYDAIEKLKDRLPQAHDILKTGHRAYGIVAPAKNLLEAMRLTPYLNIFVIPLISFTALIYSMGHVYRERLLQQSTSQTAADNTTVTIPKEELEALYDRLDQGPGKEISDLRHRQINLMQQKIDLMQQQINLMQQQKKLSNSQAGDANIGKENLSDPQAENAYLDKKKDIVSQLANIDEELRATRARRDALLNNSFKPSTLASIPHSPSLEFATALAPVPPASTAPPAFTVLLPRPTSLSEEVHLDKPLSA
jgi:hypothetical protein